MDILKGLKSILVWTKALALHSLQTDDLQDESVFLAVLSLLDDTALIQIPRAVLAPVEQELVKLLDKYQFYDQENCRLMVNELAAFTLSRVLPGTNGTLDLLLAQSTRKQFSIKLWIDEHFWDIPWQQPDIAFIRYITVLAPFENAYILNVLKKAGTELAQWTIDFALSTMNIRLLEILAQYRRAMLLNSIKAHAITDPALLPLLSDAVPCEPQALEIMTAIELNNHPVASAYLALFDIGAALRFKQYLKMATYLNKELINYLIKRVCKMHPYPVQFPLVELIGLADHDFVLHQINDNVPVYVQIEVFLKLVDKAGKREQSYFPLYRLGKIGMLKLSKPLSKLFWHILREKLQGFLPPPEYDHPLITLSSSELRPYFFRETVMSFVTDDLIPISFALNALNGSEIEKSEEDFVRAAIYQEIEQIRDMWENEKNDRYKYPDRYWNIDRQSPTSVLAAIKKKWALMNKVALQLKMDDAARSISEICAIDWESELIALSGNTARF